jgi:hypothetical protein
MDQAQLETFSCGVSKIEGVVSPNLGQSVEKCRGNL